MTESYKKREKKSGGGSEKTTFSISVVLDYLKQFFKKSFANSLIIILYNCPGGIGKVNW